MNRIKMVWCRFQQCFGTCTMLLVKWFSQTGFFRYLSDYIFGVRNFEITKSMRVIFFPKCSKFQLDFKNGVKTCEKVFYFLDNCVWIGIVKLPLFWKEQFSSAANVLRSSPNIWPINNRDASQLNWLSSNQWIS